ncbi:MAG TPA: aspartate aminotransferase family protein [bacterium (Candidatus Stahlbacteria)]|nr:aspartate aminotransferase family protein [Candidatus Stahlbacteria bacterium]
MDTFKLLYTSIIPDKKSHPERLNATFERIEEVVDLVLGDQVPPFEASFPGCEPWKEVGPDEALVIAKGLIEKFNQKEILLIAQLLNLSEISSKEAVALHEEYKIPVSRLEKDIIPISGKGAWITAADGRKYLDLDSNYSATNLGMSNGEIGRGLYNQALQLISVKEDRVHIPRARFLKTFRGMLPDGLNQFYWQNSGGEAVDKALKIAKAYTGQTGVVAFKGGFHGRTHGAVAVTYNLDYRQPFGLDNLDWVYFADFNDADGVERIFRSGKARIIILEFVQGEEAGIRPAEPGFVMELRRICDDYHGVLIADEVQTGFGRCAEKEGEWFACQTYGVVPDIITIGKSFGSGYPVTAVVTKRAIGQQMEPGYDGSTFGGNPMAMVAAMIATRKMKELNLTRNVVDRSQEIIKGLYELKARFPVIGGIRAKGLMIGFDLPTWADVKRFQKEMAKNGVKTSLSTHNAVRLLPPLIITKEEVEFMLEAMDRSLKALTEKEVLICR